MKLVMLTIDDGHLLEEISDDVISVCTMMSSPSLIKQANSRGVPVNIVTSAEQLEHFLDRLFHYDHILIYGFNEYLRPEFAKKYSVYTMMWDMGINPVLEHESTGEVVARKKVQVEKSDSNVDVHRKKKLAEKEMVVEFFSKLKESK